MKIRSALPPPHCVLLPAPYSPEAVPLLLQPWPLQRVSCHRCRLGRDDPGCQIILPPVLSDLLACQQKAEGAIKNKGWEIRPKVIMKLENLLVFSSQLQLARLSN